VAPPDASSTLARIDGAGTRGSAQARASTLLVAVGILTLCLAAPAALVSAQAPAPTADPGDGQAMTPESPAEPPAPQPQPPEAPAPLPPDDPPEPSTGIPEPEPAAPPPAPDEPAPPAADSAITVNAKTASVSILDGSSQSDYVFSPSSITVATGDTVSWTNNGNLPHDVTGDGLASGTLQSGQGYSHTFASAGSFSYICSLHPFMKGSVTVQAAGGEGGSTDAPPAATAPSSESAAVTSAGAAGSDTQLPSTGMPVWPLLAAGGGLVLAGALLRRRAQVS
jgi:plastocyanin